MSLNRVACIEIAPDALLDLLKRIRPDIPSGAKPTMCRWNEKKDCFQMVIWDRSFAEIPSGSTIPPLTPILSQGD